MTTASRRSASVRLTVEGWRYVDEPPAGLRYVADFLAAEEQRALLDEITGYAFRAVEMRGQVAKRTVAHFGYRYGYDSWTLEPAPEIPASLIPLRERAAALAGLDPVRLEQVLIARYPIGAAIGWHRDAPFFGPTVVGLSLAAPARMRFRRRREGGGYDIYLLPLAPGSAYVIGGAARSAWQHSLSPVGAERFSITFRSVVSRRP